MRIAVYGASGFVGRLIAAELKRRGIEMVLVGRDLERLRQARETAGVGDVALRVAGLESHSVLVAALRGVDAVINCATPFTHHGEPVVRAAIAAGVHYVDVAGEELYIQHILDAHHRAASAAGVTVLPAANNDCLTGDLLGHLAAEGLGELETLSIAFNATDAEGSRGTVFMAYTTQETMRSGGLIWDEGRYVAGTAARRAAVLWPGATEPTPVVKFALPPAVTIPRHVRTRRAEGLATPEIFGFFANTSRELVESMPLRGGPSPESRARARYALVIDATSVDGRLRRAVLQAPDMYGTTAIIAVEAARRLVADKPSVGARAPAEVFQPADFLDFLRPYGLTWTVEDLGVVTSPRRAATS